MTKEKYFSEESELYSWLVKKLEPICEADPEVLAKYILALLKTDRPRDEGEQNCRKQLKEFLGDDTRSFVSNLYSKVDKDLSKSLKNKISKEDNSSVVFDKKSKESSQKSSEKSSREGNKQKDGSRKKNKRNSSVAVISRSHSDYLDEAEEREIHHRRARRSSPSPENRQKEYFDEPKRRRLNDYGALSHDRISHRSQNSNYSRQTHNGRKYDSQQSQRSHSRQIHHTQREAYNPDEPEPEAYNPDEPEIPDTAKFNNHRNNDKSRRDQSPPFHSREPWHEDRGRPPPRPIFPGPHGMMGPPIPFDGGFEGPPMPGPPIPGPHMLGPRFPGYGFRGPPPPGMGFGMHNNGRKIDYNHDDLDSNPAEGGWGGMSKGKSSKQNPANKLPMEQRRTVKCIGLPSSVHLGMLAKHFSTFGNVVNIQLKPDPDHKNQAGKPYNKSLIQFDSHTCAKKCLSSPIPVLNNRFIKVFWSNVNPDPTAAAQKSPPTTPRQPPPKMPTQPQPSESENEDKLLSKKANLIKKQLEGSRQLYDRMMEIGMDDTKREKMEANILELEDKLEVAMKEPEEPEEPAVAAPVEQSKNSANEKSKEAQLLELKAKLAALEKEATSAPTVVSNGPYAHTWGGRGRNSPYRGRGRGRGRGRFVSNLDLRTKILMVEGLPDNCLASTLRSHFIMFGLLEKVEMLEEPTAAALIFFQERSSAEMAIVKGTSLGGIPLKIKWYDIRVDGPVKKVVVEAGLSSTSKPEECKADEVSEPGEIMNGETPQNNQLENKETKAGGEDGSAASVSVENKSAEEDDAEAVDYEADLEVTT
eukprot:CAMPEP_0117745302 /NCGR_PEP_ID=MMETSP0947-20121206/7275_1 /TAXON_ID=44440 /ORGANISM="Chattonella subsalsa, Strain CCMP2191" /LENGTH=810 /DNA_ID=CAMNT_0005562419 /DNA_START=29 /DNA_END=2461 /DNA_ORIENTATION=+